MAYNTNTYFILFLPLALLAYQITPRAKRYLTLLAASIIFFLLISKYLIAWAAITTTIVYFAGIFMEKIRANEVLKRKEREKKCAHVTRLALVGVVGILAALKYTNFTIEMINHVMKVVGTDASISAMKILVPIGISFYTMQAISYVLDVYWEKIEAEHNYCKLALFMIFFPTLMEGPICAYSDLSDQLFEGKPLEASNITSGCIRIGWGLFKRMVISDRLYAAISVFYRPSTSLNGVMVLIVMVATTIQLYMEFAGTIDIVIGSAQLFGVQLPENFRQPFLAKSAAEFWRRWHISLGTWFKNYIFYSVTISKPVKKWNKYARKNVSEYLAKVVTSAMALFPVWILNGLWHGPKIPYIMYGVFYFVILLAEVALEPVGKRFWKAVHLNYEGKVVGAVRMVRTWIVILVGEMLFRAESLQQFGSMMVHLFKGPWHGGLPDGRLLDFQMDAGDWVVVVLASAIVFICEVMIEKKPDLFVRVRTLPIVPRWVLYYSFIMMIVIFGAYGAGYQPADLIYAGF